MSSRTRHPHYHVSRLLLAAFLGTLLGPYAVYSQESSGPPTPAKAAEPIKADQPGKIAEGPEAVTPKAAAVAHPGKTAEQPEPVERANKQKPAKTAKGAKPKAASNVVDPDKDPDFALEGEYVGPVSTSPSENQPLALQVRPLGNGSFDAIQYLGGLPGEPLHRPESLMLVGKRSEGFVVLSGGPWAIFVEPDHCLLVDRQGDRVGRLDRIARRSPTLGALPPKDAIVLFDGTGTDQFTKARMTKDGLLMEGAYVKPMLQDFNLHLEFMLPYMPPARDQGRGNSGVYLQSRYEVQILDSFAQEPVFNGCGSLYRFRKPDVNMCLPPLVWQTYDLVFTAPRWSGDKTKLKNARISLWQNGVKIQDDVELTGPTGAGKTEEPLLLPTYLQDHGNPVRFRNVWIVDRGAAPAANFPVLAAGAGATD